MKRLLNIFISLSLMLTPASEAFASGSSSRSGSNSDDTDWQTRLAKRAYLNDLRERVKAFMDQNVVYLTSLKLCLEAKPVLMNCDENLRIVRNNISIQYPQMRKQLLLMNLLNPQTHAYLMDILQKHHEMLDSGDKPSFSYKIKHIFMTNPIESIWSYDYVPQTPFSDTEIEDALNGDTGYIEGTLYQANFSGYEKMYCESIYGVSSSICNSIKLQYSRQDKSLQFVELPQPEEWRGRKKFEISRKLTQDSYGLQKAAAKQAKKMFFEIVQLNPYIALMPSANPTDKEILFVIELMLGKAREALSEYEKRMIKLGAADVSEKDLIRLMEYGPVAMSVLEAPGANMNMVNYDYSSLFEEVSAQHEHDELMRTGAHIALLIGGNILVCMAGGRAVKYLASARKIIKLRRWHELFNPLCFSMTAVPVNGWFVYDSMNFYHQTYKEVFSSADSLHYLREVNALETAQRGVFWSIIMAPVGVGYVSKYAVIERLGLSKDFMKHLTLTGRL